MRVNVYGEELTDRLELVEKTVDEGGEPYTFYGVRFWLKFPNQDWWVHRKYKGEIDDDSSAVTIWAPTKEKLELMLRRALGVLDGRYAEYGITEIERQGDGVDRPSTLGEEASGPYENANFDSREAIDLGLTPEFATEEPRRQRGVAREIREEIRTETHEETYFDSPRTVKDNPQA